MLCSGLDASWLGQKNAPAQQKPLVCLGLMKVKEFVLCIVVIKVATCEECGTCCTIKGETAFYYYGLHPITEGTSCSVYLEFFH